jgi:hypothetical protein
MGRTKERRKILHEPSTHEIFRCLSEMTAYSKILLEHIPDKSFAEFLKWLIEVDFYNDREEKIIVKKIAAGFNVETAKATKWIKEIYQEIFELNYDKPELFQQEGIKVTLYMKAYDNHCSFYTSLPVLPREFETLRFPFAHGKVGIDYFWVKKVEHEIVENSAVITLWLEGGFLNKYREFALDKALFQGRIGFMEVYQKHSFELDDELKKIYRD